MSRLPLQRQGKATRLTLHPQRSRTHIQPLKAGSTSCLTTKAAAKPIHNSLMFRDLKGKEASLLQIEHDLTKQLNELSMNEPMTEEKLTVYKDCFNNLIQALPQHADILGQVKRAYEQLLEQYREEAQNKTLEVHKAKRTLEKHRQNAKAVHKQVNDLARENTRLAQELAEKDHDQDNGLRKVQELSRLLAMAKAETKIANHLAKERETEHNKQVERLKAQCRQHVEDLNQARQTLEVLRLRGFPVDSIARGSESNFLQVPSGRRRHNTQPVATNLHHTSEGLTEASADNSGNQTSHLEAELAPQPPAGLFEGISPIEQGNSLGFT